MDVESFGGGLDNVDVRDVYFHSMDVLSEEGTEEADEEMVDDVVRGEECDALWKLPWDVLIRIAAELRAEEIGRLGKTCKALAATLLGWTKSEHDAQSSREGGDGIWRDLAYYRFQRICRAAEVEYNGSWRERYLFYERARRLWFYEEEDFTELLPPDPTNQPITSVRVSHDGSALFVARCSGLSIINREQGANATGQNDWVLTSRSGNIAHCLPVVCMATPRVPRRDGIFAVTSSTDKRVRLWRKSKTTASWFRSLRGNTDAIKALAVSENLVVSGGRDCHVRFWPTARRSAASCKGYALHGHGRTVNYVATFLEEERILSASLDGRAKLWDTEKKRCVQTLDCHASIGCAEVSMDGSLAYLAAGAAIYVWDIRARETAAVLGTPLNTPQKISCLALRDDGFVAAGTTCGSVLAWPAAGAWTGIPLSKIGGLVGQDRAVNQIFVNKDRIIGSSYDCVRVWDATLMLKEYAHDIYTAEEDRKVTCINVAEQGEEVMIGLVDGTLLRRDFSKGRPVEDEELRQLVNLSSYTSRYWSLNSWP